MKIKTNVYASILTLLFLVGCGTSKTSNRFDSQSSTSLNSSKISSVLSSTANGDLSSSTFNSSSSSSSSNSSNSTSSNVSSTSTSNPSSSSSISSSNTSSSPVNDLTIKAVDDFRININEHVNYLTLVSANDPIDGNITHLVTVDLPSNVEMINGDLYFEEVGTYNITFNVTNSSGVSASDDVNIEVFRIENGDFTAPTILGAKDVRVKENEIAYPLDGVTAIDDIDEDVTSLLSATYETEGDATNGISFEKEGKYTIIIKAKDLSNNYSQLLITIEVNNEDLPTAVDITGLLLKEYNSSVSDSNVVPFAGATSKMVSLKHNSTDVKYANVKFVFTPSEDLNNKTFAFYIKVGDNVTNNQIGIYLMNTDNKLASLTLKITPASTSGYSVVDQGNGWHLVTIAINKQWATLSSFVVDSIRISYSNVDVTKTAIVYIANATLDIYKEGDINDNPSSGGGNSGELPLPTSDLSDLLVSNNGSLTTVNIDSEVSHDGVKSMKIKGSNTTLNQYTQALYNFENPINCDNLNISFYIKVDGTSVYSNRIAFRVCTVNDDKIDPQIYLNGTSNPTGVTVEKPDVNGWYKITIDCNTLEYDAKTVPAGEKLKYVRFTFEASDKKETTPVVEPAIWIDELTCYYNGATGDNTGGNTSHPGVTTGDLSDNMVGSNTASVSIDNEVNHDGSQSLKITGVPSIEKYLYSLAYSYSTYDLVNGTKVSFYAKLGENIYDSRIAFRIETDDGTKVTNNISIVKTNPVSGVTCTPDHDGWYLIEIDVATFTDIDNPSLSAVGKTLKCFRFGILGNDRGPDATIIPMAWIDELIISGGTE